MFQTITMSICYFFREFVCEILHNTFNHVEKLLIFLIFMCTAIASRLLYLPARTYSNMQKFGY